MSTWHQDKNRVPLWHATKWTAVTDPPNETLTVSRFDTAKEAHQYAEPRLHTYVIPPSDYTP